MYLILGSCNESPCATARVTALFPGELGRHSHLNRNQVGIRHSVSPKASRSAKGITRQVWPLVFLPSRNQQPRVTWRRYNNDRWTWCRILLYDILDRLFLRSPPVMYFRWRSCSMTLHWYLFSHRVTGLEGHDIDIPCIYFTRVFRSIRANISSTISMLC